LSSDSIHAIAHGRRVAGKAIVATDSPAFTSGPESASITPAMTKPAMELTKIQRIHFKQHGRQEA
jgi:hypothetical protein